MYNIVELSKVFIRFKKYKISIKLLELSLSIKKNDLFSVIKIIEIYKKFNDKVNIDKYYKIGKNIIYRDKYCKYKNYFENIDSDINNDIKLINIDNIGIFMNNGTDNYIQSDKNKYKIYKDAEVNKKLKAGDKVYFATYLIDGKYITNFIEPHFDNIDDLKSLK